MLVWPPPDQANKGSVFIQEDWDTIPDEHFAYRNTLRRVTFASGGILKRIGNGAFRSCKYLEEIEIPATVEEIGENCFEGCNSLSRVTFAGGSVLKRIGGSPFMGCTKLTSLEIPGCVQEICGGCFSGCNIGELTFSGSSPNFRSSNSLIINNDTNCAISVFGHVTDVTIPGDVEVIGQECFCCSSVARVVFQSESVLKRIEKRAFYGCVKLQEIEIPATVEEIGDECFYCEWAVSIDDEEGTLSRVTFASGSVLKRIGKRAFKCQRSGLSEIEIPASVEEIGEFCFSECQDLATVTFASGSRLKRLADGTFHRCRNISEIEIPAGVEEIGRSCFYDEDGEGNSLTSVTFAEGSVLKRIGYDAFAESVELEEIEIPASVEELDDNCFSFCSILSRVTFASGSVLKRIGKYAFVGCEELQEIKIPATVQEMDNSFESTCQVKRIGEEDDCEGSE